MDKNSTSKSTGKRSSQQRKQSPSEGERLVANLLEHLLSKLGERQWLSSGDLHAFVTVGLLA
jgi:hypothetical protein